MTDRLTDGQTDKLIWGGLGNMGFLQDKMYSIRNYYRPPLDEASKIIWKILLR